MTLNKKQYLIRMQICLASEEYERRREPYFVRFLDNNRRLRHVKVEAYRYVRDCVLETSFYHDSPDAFPAQTPVVCFDKEDGGNVEDDMPPDKNVELYGALFDRLKFRDSLEKEFPEMKQTGVGFLESQILVFLRLGGSFSVAVSSDSGIPIFAWDKRFLFPYQEAAPRMGDGFRVAMPSIDGSIQDFWYERKKVQMFLNVGQVIEYVDSVVYGGSSKRIDGSKFVDSDSILAKSDIIRAQIHHLKCSFPGVKVASFSRVSNQEVRVYIDQQWRCEVSGL